MRTSILSLCLFVGTTLTAQDKGFVCGTFAFDNRTIDRNGSDNDRTITSGTFGPAVGYNITPVHVVGLALTFSGLTEEYKIDGPTNTRLRVTEKRNLTTIAPFYRYMKSVNENFLLYGQVKAGFGFGSERAETETFNNENETKLNTTDVRVGPGIAYVVADRWALTADWGILGFYSEKSTFETPTQDLVTTTSGVQASLSPANIVFALNWLF